MRHLVLCAFVVVSSQVVALADRQVKAPTAAKPTPIAVEKAEADGLVTLIWEGDGGSSGDVIVLRIQRVANRILRLALKPGTTLTSRAANVQNMVVYALKGEYTSASQYRPANVIELSDDKEHRYVVEAYCLDFEQRRERVGTGLKRY